MNDYRKPFEQQLRKIALILLCTMTLTISTAIYSTSSAHEEQMRSDLMKRIYPSTGRIVAIDEEGGTITIKSGGDVYWLYDDIRDFKLKDPVSFLVDDGGTFGDYSDDKILKLHYAGGL